MKLKKSHHIILKMKLVVTVMAFVLISSSLPAGTKDLLSAANVETLHQIMQPQPEEVVWRSIPWHPNLWAARREAAKAGKPIYLWEMDGHPLGCT